MENWDMHGKVAIVGIGQTERDARGRKTCMDLYIQATKMALEDAGLTKEDIDGILVIPFDANKDIRNHFHFAELLGEGVFAKKLCESSMVGGSTSGYAIDLASYYLLSRQCKNVLVVGGGIWKSSSVPSKVGRRSVELTSGGHNLEFEIPYGPTMITIYGLVAQRHMFEFGITNEQMAMVAVACRKHAGLNPLATMRLPITVENVLNSRWVSTPFHLLDCSIPQDIGYAYVVTTKERAKTLRKPPVVVLGTAWAGSYYTLDKLCAGNGEFDLVHTVAKVAGDRAFAQAGVSRKDIDVAELYDSFTTTVLIQLEDYGFCPKGESGRFVEGGRIELGGELPVNTHGGLLSDGHPGMGAGMSHLVEAVVQLRGEGGERQVKEAKLAFVGGASGVISNFSATILGKE